VVAGNAGRATPNILEHADFEGTRSSTNSSNSAPESPENVLTALPAPSPISLPSGFWQALLYGSRDALVPAPRTPQRYTSDNTSAWQGFQCGPIQRQRSGQHAAQNVRWVGAEVWHVTNKLWRAAPASLGAPTPNEDQRHCGPGVRGCPRFMPA